MQLQKDQKRIAGAGIQIIGISYDKPATLAAFATKRGIEFPLLSDPDSKVIKQFRLLNSGASGRKAGIAHPMTVLIDKRGVIRAKLDGTVRKRHNAEQLIAAWASRDVGGVTASVPPALNFTMKDIAGKDVALTSFAGRVVVVVNVASECGATGQYEPLQALYKKYRLEGLVVLGFPCNQFGGQEPGTESEIQEFCKANYGVSFPMFSKVEVKGKKQAPLFKHLTAQDTKPIGKGDVGWNFEKFIIDRDGKVAARFGTSVSPDDREFVGTISRLLVTKKRKESDPAKRDASRDTKHNPKNSG